MTLTAPQTRQIATVHLALSFGAVVLGLLVNAF